MRALRSFSAVYDGERVEVVAGVTSCEPNHELVRRYPDRFGPEPDVEERAEVAESNGSSRSDRPRLTAQQETAVRAARIRELEQRDRDEGRTAPAGLRREPGPETQRERAEAAWWAAVDEMLFPGARAEAEASNAFYDDLRESDRRRLRAEVDELSDWLGDAE